MKRIKLLLIAFVILINAVFAYPAWADAGKFIKSPEYLEVTQAIADLTNPEKSSDLSSEARLQKLADLRFQKYVLETAEDSTICRNDTAQNLAVYARSGKTAAPTLYFLGAGQELDDDVECVGLYLPQGSKVLLGATEQELTEPLAVRFVPGTRVVASANPDTGVVEFNAPPLSAGKTGDAGWTVPTLTQAEVEAQIPNAPVD